MSHSLTRTIHRSKTKYTKYLSNNSFYKGKKNNEFGLQVGLFKYTIENSLKVPSWQTEHFINVGLYIYY